MSDALPRWWWRLAWLNILLLWFSMTYAVITGGEPWPSFRSLDYLSYCLITVACLIRSWRIATS